MFRPSNFQHKHYQVLSIFIYKNSLKIKALFFREILGAILARLESLPCVMVHENELVIFRPIVGELLNLEYYLSL
jgi:hypothetical protein